MAPFKFQRQITPNLVKKNMNLKNNIYVYTVKTITLSVLFFIFISTGCTGNNDDSPKKIGIEFVNDQASLLSKAEKNHITQLTSALLKDMDIHIMAVVLKESPDDIDYKAVTLFQKYGVGRSTHGAKGILFLIDPQGKQVRIDIGYDLEPIFTDSFTGYIERKQMTPFFQANKVGPGIEATIELLVGKALGKLESLNHTKPEDTQQTGRFLSGGGGSRSDVKIGSKSIEKEASPLAKKYQAQPSVLDTLDKYIEVLRLHIKDPNLGIYTPDTRKFFSNWVVTDAQQDNELRVIHRAISTSEIFTKDNLAVIRFSYDLRQASPFFLEKGSRGWMLDFASMSKLIGFNHENQWHLRQRNHKYMFGFREVYFDQNGFPHKNN
jgi:uncharacterized protein